jgi:hypothetical protein
MDTDNWNTSQLAYLGDDLQNVGDISYEYNYGGSVNGLILNDEGISGFGGGNGEVSNPFQYVNITVMWNGQKESFVLQP